MNKVSKKDLNNPEGKEFLRKFVKENYDKIISAQKYYVGNPDERFITHNNFDEETVKSREAYETINTLMGDDTAELVRFIEGKKQTIGLISAVGLQKICDMICLFFAFASIGEPITYNTVRVCKQNEINKTAEGELKVIKALKSSTKLPIEKIMDLGYGNKSKLAICKYNFKPRAVVLDMARFGKDYLKPEEKEVLILIGNKYNSKCIGFSDKFYDKDGEPAIMYDINIYPPDPFGKHIDISREELKKTVFDNKKITEIRKFYEALNDNIGKEWPQEPPHYRKWKKAFKLYLYSELDKIYIV